MGGSWRHLVGRGEGLVRGLVLVYHSSSSVPCIWASVGGPSGGHSGNSVLDLGTEVSPELDNYGFGVGVAGIGYQVLEFVYILIQGATFW